VEDKDFVKLQENVYEKLKGWYGVDIQLRMISDKFVDMELSHSQFDEIFGVAERRRSHFFSS